MKKTMKSLSKKIGAVLIACAMVVSMMATVSFADETTPLTAYTGQLDALSGGVSYQDFGSLTVVDAEEGIFVNGTSGVDTNDGTTALKAVKTLGRALEIRDSETIYVTGTVTLSGNTDLTGYTNLVIKRSRSFTGNMFSISANATVSLANITIDGNNTASAGGGAIFNVTGAESTLNIGSGTNLINNTGTSGGAVYATNGTINMTGGTISGNVARFGGGMYIGGSAKASLSGGTITSNTATSCITSATTTAGGGGIYLTGSAELTQSGTCAITENIAYGSVSSGSSYGGGLYLNGGTYTLNGGSISGNLLDGQCTLANGIYDLGGTFNLDPTVSTTLTDTVYLCSGKEIYCGDSLSLLANDVTVKVADEMQSRIVAVNVNEEGDNCFTYENGECVLTYSEDNTNVYISAINNTGTGLQLMEEQISTLEDIDWSVLNTFTSDFTIPDQTVLKSAQYVSGGTADDPIVVTIAGNITSELTDKTTVSMLLVQDGSYVEIIGENDAKITCGNTMQYMIVLDSANVTMRNITIDAANLVTYTPVYVESNKTCNMILEDIKIINCAGNTTNGNSGGILTRYGVLTLDGVEMSNVTCKSSGYGECVRGYGTTMVIKDGNFNGCSDSLQDIYDVKSGCSAAINPTGNISIGKMNIKGGITLTPQSGSAISSYKLVNTDGTEVTDIPTAETSLGTAFTSLDIEISEAPTAPTFAASISNVSSEMVAAGDTFTADVVLTSDTVPASAALDLSVNSEVAKIVSITPAEGIGTTESTVATDGVSGKVSFYGNTASAAEGLKVATVTFEAVADGTASIALTSEGAAVSGDPADYDITVPETATTVTVKTPTIEAVDCGGNYKLAKYTPQTEVAEGKTVMYGEQAMYSKDGCWYCVIDKDVTPSVDSVSITEGTATAYADVAKGDVNENEKINIVDAQLAYDIANSVYSGFDKLSALGILKADANGDMTVDASDARAIQVYVHTGAFTVSGN